MKKTALKNQNELTSKSRLSMTLKNRGVSGGENKKGGFTLIELMVVISIIAFLSLIVLASLTATKANARNAKRLQLVKQYANALELYRIDNNKYPDAATQYCLGEVGSNVCIGGAYSGNSTLNSSLDKYIRGTPTITDPILVGGSDFHGLTYLNCAQGSCLGGSLNSTYQLYWLMEGASTCGNGLIWSSSPVICYYNPK